PRASIVVALPLETPPITATTRAMDARAMAIRRLMAAPSRSEVEDSTRTVARTTPEGNREGEPAPGGSAPGGGDHVSDERDPRALVGRELGQGLAGVLVNPVVDLRGDAFDQRGALDLGGDEFVDGVERRRLREGAFGSDGQAGGAELVAEPVEVAA